MKDLFQFLGADEKETATYLKLLELGAQAVSVVAKHMNMPRSSMYTVLDRLKELDLVQEFQRSGIKYVKATPSKDLPLIVKMRQQNLEKGLTLIQERLPQLQAIENKLGVTPTVTFYEGKKAVMKMYEKILEHGGFCAFFNPKLVKQMMPEYHFKIGETIREKKWHVRELLVDGSEADEYKKKFLSKRHEIRILKKNIKFASDTIIGGDSIFMISYGESDLTGTEIQSHSLAHTQKTLFDLLWGK